jgi:hemerythrin-like domain-containing protein
MKMKATDILMDEHRVIERLIAVLEKATLKLQKGEAMRPEFFLEASAFIKGFADGCHHQKEEGVLFKAMEAHGLSQQKPPISVMLSEHERGREFNRGLKQAGQRLAYGDKSAIGEIIKDAGGYASLLRQHIEKEDKILFPLANQVIPASEHEQVFKDFEKVEHEETGEGVHEKYLHLVEKLEKEML